MFDKVISEILNINDLLSNVYCKRFITQQLKYLGNIINAQYINKLKYRIYLLYDDTDFLLLKFICHREFFREDIFEKVEYVKMKIMVLNM